MVAPLSLALAAASKSAPIPIGARHRDLYFTDGSVTLLAEDTLFRVHKAWLQRCSTAFKTALSIPSPDGGEGMSDENPVLLAVSALDLERFLYVLYPPTVGLYEPCSLNEWISVCRVASMFDAQSIRQLAIREMGPLCHGPVQRIVLAQLLDISQWLMPAYAELTVRDSPVTLEEGKLLGVETVERPGQVRGKLRSHADRDERVR
ncbi:hypothetical protein BKA62DRAFT_769859 [Auriculariales sp. MPI-PUGE-AT-0066]|nr:hypothetical protein BKA62DRAFT_769859 [Auriculariales sp. MPI-PUGE-AT-0066]